MRPTPVRRIGTLSTVLANGALYVASVAQLSTPFSVLVLGGVCFRCVTLPLSLYGDQCLSRAAAALPELHEAHRHYTDIATHPHAILWEKRVAAQKLKNDRDRIFRSYRTNNVKMVAPHAASLALSCYMLGIPSQQLGTYLTTATGTAIVSPLSAAAVTSAFAAPQAASSVLMALDPTLAVAATVTLFNVFQHLRQRAGFNDRMDNYLQRARRCGWGVYGVTVACALLAGPLAALTHTTLFFPSYLGPVWLGMAGTTAAKTVLLTMTRPGRALARIAERPPEHGGYGPESTAEGDEYRLHFTGVDAEERRHAWQIQKRALDYECDVRLHATLTKLGLFDPVEEIEYEAEILKKKQAAAHERALRRKAQELRDAEEPAAGNAASGQVAQGGSSGGPTLESSGLDGDRPLLPSERRRAQRAMQKEKRARDLARAAAATLQDDPMTADSMAASGSGGVGVSDVTPGGRWEETMSATASPKGAAFGAGAVSAQEVTSRNMETHIAEEAQWRMDMTSTRESSYRQRSLSSPTNWLLHTDAEEPGGCLHTGASADGGGHGREERPKLEQPYRGVEERHTPERAP